MSTFSHLTPFHPNPNDFSTFSTTTRAPSSSFFRPMSGRGGYVDGTDTSSRTRSTLYCTIPFNYSVMTHLCQCTVNRYGTVVDNVLHIRLPINNVTPNLPVLLLYLCVLRAHRRPFPPKRVHVIVLIVTKRLGRGFQARLFPIDTIWGGGGISDRPFPLDNPFSWY